MDHWLPITNAAFDRLRQHDWSNSPLGPLEGWPDVLRTTVSLALASHFPQAIVWGPELITLYNEAFLPILGEKPEAMGRPFNEVWEEAWEHIKPIAEAAYAGQPTFIENFPLIIRRSHSLEQAYFTFCYAPIRDSTGKVVGLLDTVVETTKTVLATHRLEILEGITSAVSNATDPLSIMESTCRRLVEHLHLSSCAYADMDADGDGFTIRGDWADKQAPSISGHYRLADFGVLAVRALNAGKPLIINDNRDEIAPEEAATFQAIGITATVCVPLIKDGRLTALMAIHDNVPRGWSSYEVELLLLVADRCWAHIERARAHASVRDGLAALAALNATLEKRVEERSGLLAQAEAALRQSQKLEAIGQLTGGVAHDFNNLLTIIRSSIDFLQQPGLSNERKAKYVKAISDTVDRASKLTGQLLAFARRQPLKPMVFDACERAEELGDMLSNVTGALIKVEVVLCDEECYVLADVNQFDTAIVNMALNARDAMEGQGTLLLSVKLCEPLPALGAQSRADHEFVGISLTDTGGGIPPSILEKIFEPFFTTKDVSKGTGLGLSQVYGFAKQSGGDVDVQTVLGKGSVFTLYLPRTDRPLTQAHNEIITTYSTMLPYSKRVLVVEDNIEIGYIAVQILESLDYIVGRAHDSKEALMMMEGDARQFDAVFSDVVMPGESGISLARELRRRRGDLPIVLTSGYSLELAEMDGMEFEFVAKPYSAEQIKLALRKLLPG
ncbi:GAF domain-containing protein [Pseudomonas koreensis]|uniref:GAF domain-containing hybrid sensor histidine kinase/response regulator n=1 Tax=Pseudomonas koreensis TaxID=198620 RepID=UPI0021C66931|nr:GAF domain-containing protein [Pseudomonas koreensis]MCU0073848.1 GAF domain-containing protein [Pseudomonas koreensis]